MEDSVAKIGRASCADMILAEIVDRFDSPLSGDGDGENVTIRMVFVERGVEESRILRASRDGIQVVDPDDAVVDATISHDLCELAQLTYGFTGAADAASRRVALRDIDKLASYKKAPVHFFVVQRILEVIDRRGATGLTELAGRYGADKWGIHLYTEHYERHFARLRDRQLTILEIGIGGFADPSAGGSSLRMWRHYFPRAVVHGVDIHDKSPHNELRIQTHCGDQSDASFFTDLVAQVGPFDIIIDDGSHVSEHVLASFRTLFPLMRPGGIYAIEDLQTSYWPRFGGSSLDVNSPQTSMGFLKGLVDGLNHEEFLVDAGREPQPFDADIKTAHFYHNLAILEKGFNREGGGPDWARFGLDSNAPR
ncbi:hypothetical protein GCM10022247_35140 [Allokutzneria multivorans]|uniref:Methyltransferase MycE N-terminal domain-containing protein n=1 Tax=Allokutzneria multivorans TaxID=1142134 RepID=A0ABP7SCR4_9PSEU